MNEENDKLPPIVRLHYKPGETIIKKGDYGISIYLIVKGKVEIFLESAEKDIHLAFLGPGEIIGEMIFLTGNRAQRSASARAIGNTVLESWHASRITTEYDSIPVTVKYITNQILKRLIHMNRLISQLESAKAKEHERKNVDPWEKQRKFYRKEVDLVCIYSPVQDKDRIKLWGQIKDLSKIGMRLEVPDANSFQCSHKPGDKFFASAQLPTGKRIEVTAEIVRVYEPPSKGTLALGMLFHNVNQGTEHVLGFFLMR